MTFENTAGPEKHQAVALRSDFLEPQPYTSFEPPGNELRAVGTGDVARVARWSDKRENREIPESLPCLHDKVIAAAADAAFSFSSNQKKKQSPKSGILSGFVKGFKGGKIDDLLDTTPSPKANCSHLEGIFSRPLFSDSSETVPDNQKVIELNIDDIEIDESPLLISTTLQEANNTKKEEKKTEREQLLGEAADAKPRARTAEEIKAKYRKAGDASSAAGEAKNKLLERQEKLERISQRTTELQNGAEDFASLAGELAKKMEKQKWYHI